MFANPRYGPARAGRIPTWVKPPAAAKKIAKAALARQKDLPKSKRGGLTNSEAGAQGITSGVERAKSIARGDLQPAEDIVAFFNRFKGIHADATSMGKAWEDSKVQQAWDLWGGNPMWDVAVEAISRETNPAGFTLLRGVVTAGLAAVGILGFVLGSRD